MMLRLALCVAVLATVAAVAAAQGLKGGPPGCGRYQCPAYTTESLGDSTELRRFTAQTWWAQASEVKNRTAADEQMGHRGPGADGAKGELDAKVSEMMAKVEASGGGKVGDGELLKMLQWLAKGQAGGRPGATRSMYGKLSRYINGANEMNKKMPMAIPVTKKFDPQGDGSMMVTMQFYLADADRPKPTDADVTVTPVRAGKQFYVRSFLVARGDAVRGPKRFKQELQTLKDTLTQAGKAFHDTAFYKASYSPPWVWPKYTEVWLDA